MTTIDTFDDILAAMDRDPQLLEAVRERVLDAEIRRLPASVQELREMIAELRQMLRDYIAATNERLDRLEAGQAELKAGQAELRADVSELKAGQARIEERQDRADTDIKEIKNDMSDIKGQLVPLHARRMVGRIADVTQSRRPRWMENTDIIDISDDADTSDVPPNELESFRAIDLAMRAVAKNVPGNPEQYIVIECTGTITRNDVTRAARNAEYMTRFTGKPSQAVVIGYNIPDAIAELARERAVHCIMVTNKSARPR